MLAAMPGFSVLAAIMPNSNIALPGAANSFVAQLKDGDIAILTNDSNIQNIEHVFINSTYLPFKNTFSFNTTYSKTDFLQKYGYDLVYLDQEHIIKVGSTFVNDPGFGSDPTNTDRQWGLYKAHFPEACYKLYRL